MATQDAQTFENITLTDVQLASAYYPILVELARQKSLLTYGELVARAKEKFPENAVVKNAIPVSTGRRLYIVRIFTEKHGYPDLTSLIVNKIKRECGKGYTEYYDPIAERQQVLDFNWDDVTMDFDGFIKASAVAVTPRKKVKLADAPKMMSEYFYANKEALPPEAKQWREIVIELITEGFSPAEAFAQAALHQ